MRDYLKYSFKTSSISAHLQILVTHAQEPVIDIHYKSVHFKIIVSSKLWNDTSFLTKMFQCLI